MAGQIIKRGDKTWCVSVFTGRDGNGHRRYMNKTIRGNRKDAETYLSTTLTNISGGTFVEPVKLTIEEYFDKWLATAAKARLRERTHDDYSEKLNRYVRNVICKLKLSDLRPLDAVDIHSNGRAWSFSAHDTLHSPFSAQR
ncbi:MAG: hypothetical protein ACR2H4_20355 [Pyrinomonadaceae bacterium]